MPKPWMVSWVSPCPREPQPETLDVGVPRPGTLPVASQERRRSRDGRTVLVRRKSKDVFTANVLSGLHNLSTCLTVFDTPLSTRRLRRSPFGCSHSPAPSLFGGSRPSPLLVGSRLRLCAIPNVHQVWIKGSRPILLEGYSEDGSAARPLFIREFQAV